MPSSLAEYSIIEIIGKGTFGNVYKARHLLTNQIVAIKFVSKTKKTNTETPEETIRQSIMNEVKIFQMADHPLITQFLDSFEDDNNIYIVQECCEGGSFLNFVNSRHGLQEDLCKFYFLQLLSVVEYMHTVLHIVHRDLKMENLLLDKNNNLRLIDFGLSHQLRSKRNCIKCKSRTKVKKLFKSESNNSEVLAFDMNLLSKSSDSIKKFSSLPKDDDDENKKEPLRIPDSSSYDENCAVLTEACGTPAYVAPEVILRKGYGYQIDVWGLGILLFAMAVGRLPFYSEDINYLVHQIAYEPIIIPKKVNSPQIRNLIEQMLQKDPSQRIKLNEIRNHQWLRGCFTCCRVFSITSTTSFIVLPQRNGCISPRVENEHQPEMKTNLKNSDDCDIEEDIFFIDYEIVEKMIDLGIDVSSIEDDLFENVVNSNTAIYKLLRREKLTEELNAFIQDNQTNNQNEAVLADNLNSISSCTSTDLNNSSKNIILYSFYSNSVIITKSNQISHKTPITFLRSSHSYDNLKIFQKWPTPLTENFALPTRKKNYQNDDIGDAKITRCRSNSFSSSNNTALELSSASPNFVGVENEKHKKKKNVRWRIVDMDKMNNQMQQKIAKRSITQFNTATQVAFSKVKLNQIRPIQRSPRIRELQSTFPIRFNLPS